MRRPWVSCSQMVVPTQHLLSPMQYFPSACLTDGDDDDTNRGASGMDGCPLLAHPPHLDLLILVHGHTLWVGNFNDFVNAIFFVLATGSDGANTGFVDGTVDANTFFFAVATGFEDSHACLYADDFVLTDEPGFANANACFTLLLTDQPLSSSLLFLS